MTTNERNAVMTALRGLLNIARLAMPETYFYSDTRIRRAQRLMARLKNNLSARLNNPRKATR